jgi:hypothetical protein
MIDFLESLYYVPHTPGAQEEGARSGGADIVERRSRKERVE